MRTLRGIYRNIGYEVRTQNVSAFRCYCTIFSNQQPTAERTNKLMRERHHCFGLVLELEEKLASRSWSGIVMPLKFKNLSKLSKTAQENAQKWMNLAQLKDLLKNDSVPRLQFSDVEKNFTQEISRIRCGFIWTALIPGDPAIQLTRDMKK